MNCDNWLEPKNSFMAAATGFALIMSWGIKPSESAILKRSFTARSTRTSPTRNWFSAISPTERTRRLPKWSISSTEPNPFLIPTKVLTTSTISSVTSTEAPTVSGRPSRRLNFMRPTAERSYRSGEKNRLENKFSADSLVGGSPGRIMR